VNFLMVVSDFAL